MRTDRTHMETRKTKKMMKMRSLNEDRTHMEEKKKMKMRALNEDRTHMEDKEDDENESIE
jgi:hypothetical protein